MTRPQTDKAGAMLSPLLRRVAPSWRFGTLELSAPDGTDTRLEGREPGPRAALRILDLKALRRLVFGGDVGFAEAYLAGEWETPDLRALLHAAALNFDRIALMRGGALSRLSGLLQHWRNRNTLGGARRNILAHYDLGNEFYRRWLDETMTYSAALFDRPEASLAEAQQRKYQALAERIGLTSEHHVLEIGCGWGGFAEFAAGQIGARITAITISPAQAEFARARLARAGHSDRAEVKLCDYREVEGRFDRIVSIEMIEAVGERYWPAYFTQLAELLKPGGVAGLQAITIERDRFATYRARPDFIQRHIFPGGMLVSEARLAEETARVGLALGGLFRFGSHYARTLEHWARNFNEQWSEIAPLGFDARFRRLWNYYLAYCEAGFRTGQIDVVQLALQKI